MRGLEKKQASMLILLSPESRVPSEHPLREVKRLADAALRELSPTFDAMYSGIGRPSIPPERLLRATLLMAFYSIRSERQFCEQLDYNLLFRWFLDMDMEEETFDVTVFTKNRERLLAHDVAGKFFQQIVKQARAAKLMSSEHFTVDGTLIEAWASLKSFQPKSSKGRKPPPDDPGNPSVDFHGKSAATTRMLRRQTLKPSWRANRMARRRSCRSRRTRSWRIDTACSWTFALRKLTVRRSERRH
jgi:transposase